MYQRARALERAGDFEGAIKLYVELLRQAQVTCKTPSRATSINWRSRCGRRLKLTYGIAIARRDQGDPGKTQAAIRAYLTTSRRLFPRAKVHHEAEMRFHLATAERRLGHHQQALDDYRAAIRSWAKRQPKARAPFKGKALQGIAAMLAKLGRHKEASSAYTALLDEHRAHHRRPHPDASYLRGVIAKLEAKAKVKAKGAVVISAGKPPKAGDDKRKLSLVSTTDSRSDDRREQTAASSKSTPVYKTWWFWAIIGGVAIAGGATAVGVAASGDSRVPHGPLVEL
ncbi:MAG: hypothetical protein CSA65_00245 [Proteobacteria bacterium]|nr:MAG: hypothetical protein CSB49_06790 [Pseudomonadota bacterium]PIE19912.1 MAG: hypothetical protein CSA65_00245 [Pseudomonadota bacterium]